MVKSNDLKAEALMEVCSGVWDKLNICCGWSGTKGNDKIGYSVEEKKEAHDNLLIQEIRKLGYNKTKKVSNNVRLILENENYHTLNRVLQENDLGKGNY